MKKYLIIAFAAACMFAGTAVYANETVQAEATVTAEISTESNVETTQIPPRDSSVRKAGIRKDILEKRIELQGDAMMQKESLLGRREALENKFEEKKNMTAERREALVKKFDEQTQSMRLRFQEQYAKKAIRGFAQVEHLLARFEANIAKMKSDGKDTVSAEAKLAVVNTLVLDAKVKLEALKSLYPTNGTEMTAEMKASVTAAKEAAETAVKAVHAEMRALLQIIKELGAPKASVSADASVETAQ